MNTCRILSGISNKGRIRSILRRVGTGVRQRVGYWSQVDVKSS
jgi:hypothetical protein